MLLVTADCKVYRFNSSTWSPRSRGGRSQLPFERMSR